MIINIVKAKINLGIMLKSQYLLWVDIAISAKESGETITLHCLKCIKEIVIYKRNINFISVFYTFSLNV